LPPKGPPGIKGRRLRADINSVIDALEDGNVDEAKSQLSRARRRYDANEP
jgi:hypothetical protein